VRNYQLIKMFLRFVTSLHHRYVQKKVLIPFGCDRSTLSGIGGGNEKNITTSKTRMAQLLQTGPIMPAIQIQAKASGIT
jgi:hypothetical protein